MTVKSGVGIGVAAFAAAAALVFVISGQRRDLAQDSTPSSQSSGNVVERSSEQLQVKPTRTPQAAVPSATPVAKSGWQELLHVSTDYLDLVNRALRPAGNGDTSAQFALYEALSYCETGYRAYFDRPGKRRTLDEALSWASTRPTVSMEHVREVHGRCQALMAGELGEIGSSESWLERSSAGGFPPAQARRALADLEAVERQSASTTDRSSAAAEEFETRRSSARALLLKSLATGDPSATWDAADSIKFISGSESTAEREQWVWRMAACIQGYDCAAGAAWLVAACQLYPYCPPGESGTEYIRRVSGQDEADLEMRAQELAGRLRSGDFNDEDMKTFMAVPRAH